MSGAPEQDIVKATKEDSIITEAARVSLAAHQGRAFDGNARHRRTRRWKQSSARSNLAGWWRSTRST